MNRIEKLLEKLEASKSNKEKFNLIDSFGRKCFKAGGKRRLDIELSLLDNLKLHEPDYEQWKESK